jgi:hypothetical protein
VAPTLVVKLQRLNLKPATLHMRAYLSYNKCMNSIYGHVSNFKYVEATQTNSGIDCYTWKDVSITSPAVVNINVIV